MIRNIRIGLRSAVAFSILGLITLILGIFAITRLSALNNATDIMSEHRLPAAIKVGDMRGALLYTRLAVVTLFDAETRADTERYTNLINTRFAAYLKAEQEMAGFIVAEQGRRHYSHIQKLSTEYKELLSQLVKLFEQGQQDQALALRRGKMNEVSEGLVDALTEFVSFQQNRAQQASDAATEIFSTSTTALIAGIVIALLSMAVLAWLFSQSLIQPLRIAVNVAQRIAARDLTTSFSDNTKDEAADMIRALAEMQDGLKETLRMLSDSSQQLATTSEELSVVTNESTEVMTRQSDELEQAATAVTELTTAIEEVARNASATSQESDVVDERAQNGQQKVQETIGTIESLVRDIQNTMKGVEQLAFRVGDISTVLDVIRAIAEQTNLLALNAAIEAARAGESGRGFAVVADEVRALAHRTQESTKEIESMMKSVQSDTDHTVKAMQNSNQQASETLAVANEAGAALKQIAHGISQINDKNITIASAAEEQATVAREVDRNLVNIRDLAAQTASGANETSASSAELARLAEQLNQLILRFKM